MQVVERQHPRVSHQAPLPVLQRLQKKKGALDTLTINMQLYSSPSFPPPPLQLHVSTGSTYEQQKSHFL